MPVRIRSIVSRVRLSGLETNLNLEGSSTNPASFTPLAFAWLRPSLFRSVSYCPCTRPCAFHAVSPWRENHIRGNLSKRKIAWLIVHSGNIRGVHGLHTDNMITAIDMQYFASHRTGQVRQQIQSGIANFVDCDSAFQWRIIFIPL